MTVGELRFMLAALHDDWQVILSSDAEGNSYSPLSEIATGWYEADSTWSGDIIFPDEDEDPERINALILWPVN